MHEVTAQEQIAAPHLYSTTYAYTRYAYTRAGDSIHAPVLSDGQATYTQGLGIISEVRGAGSYLHKTDGLGTTRAMTRTTGTTTDTLSTDAFGNTTASSGSTVTPFGFVGGAGYETDSDTGLMLLGHRYYDPSTGRFLSRDIAHAGYNWYTYCHNDPVNGIDPQGLATWNIGFSGGINLGPIKESIEVGIVIEIDLVPSGSTVGRSFQYGGTETYLTYATLGGIGKGKGFGPTAGYTTGTLQTFHGDSDIVVVETPTKGLTYTKTGPPNDRSVGGSIPIPAPGISGGDASGVYGGKSHTVFSMWEFQWYRDFYHAAAKFGENIGLW